MISKNQVNRRQRKEETSLSPRNDSPRSIFFALALSILQLLSSCRQNEGSSVQTIDPTTNEFVYPCIAEDSIAAITNLLQNTTNYCARENRRLGGITGISCPEGCLTDKSGGTASSSGGFQLSMDIDQSLTNLQSQTLALKVRYTFPSKASVTTVTCENPVNSTRFISSMTDYLKVQCEALAKSGMVDTSRSFQPGVEYGTAKDLLGVKPVGAQVRLRVVNAAGECGSQLKAKYLNLFANEIIVKTRSFLGTSISCGADKVAVESAISSEQGTSNKLPSIYVKASTQGSMEFGFELVPRGSLSGPSTTVCLDPKLTAAYRQFESFLNERWSEILLNSGCPKP